MRRYLWSMLLKVNAYAVQKRTFGEHKQASNSSIITSIVLI
jgi:hypothetical protein